MVEAVGMSHFPWCPLTREITRPPFSQSSHSWWSYSLTQWPVLFCFVYQHLCQVLFKLSKALKRYVEARQMHMESLTQNVNLMALGTGSG